MRFEVRMMAVLALALAGGCDDAEAPGEARRSPLSAPSSAPRADARSSDGQNVEIAGKAGGEDVLQAQAPSLLPLARILQIARGRVPGEVIDVELEDEHGIPEYEVKILTAESRAIEIKIDARSGAIRKLEEED